MIRTIASKNDSNINFPEKNELSENMVLDLEYSVLIPIKKMKKNLPTSPHLQIYKPQITSLLSITHRVTGFGLNFAVILLQLMDYLFFFRQ